MLANKALRRTASLVLALAGVAMMPKFASAAAVDSAPMAAAANTFGTDLYQELSAKPGNFFFSPYSISSALTMTQRGARDKTADEMAKVLHLPAAQVNEASGALIGQLSADPNKTGYQLNVANALWLQTGAAFKQDYLATAHDSFHAGLEQLDFAGHADPSRVTINDWVAKQTNDKIKDLLPQGSVTPDTRLVLTNAIYFKAAWETPFTKGATSDGDFTLLDGGKAKTPLMHMKSHFGYLADASKAVLSMPYKGDDLSMVVILPNKTDADSLATVEKSLTADSIKGPMGKLASQDVVVTLPKWKMTQRFELAPTLKAMGMKLAFGPGADFSGINGRSDLFISAVIHQAYIDVNEEGTEAAAATAVVMVGSAARPSPQQPIVFNADHPFVYAIVHRATNTILFMGRIEDPTK